MEKEKIIIVGSGDAGKVAAKVAAEKLMAEGKTTIIVDDFNEAKKLIEGGEYTKQLSKILDENESFKLEITKSYASDLTKKQLNAPYAEPVRSTPKIQNNEPCHCGSGKKFKKCCKK